jgi:hypothetical protein
MSDELGRDPRRLVEDGRAGKQQARERLVAALAGYPDSEASPGHRDDRAEAIARRIAPVVDAAIGAALADESLVPKALVPHDQPVRGGFDGGARTSVPAAGPTHDEWLVEVIRQRLADRGGGF